MGGRSTLDLIAAHAFAPFYRNNTLEIGKEDHKKGFLYGIIACFLGWLSMAWLFVHQERVVNYLHGDWYSEAKVFAYENNGEFMLYMTGFLFLVTWFFPTLLQVLLNATMTKDHKGIRLVRTES